MSKYTMTIEEYCVARFLAYKLEEDPSYPPIMAPMEMTLEDAYQIVAHEIFTTAMPFYNDDTDDAETFLEEWTDTFYFTEIGQETIQRFRIVFQAWMRNNMPYFAELYKARLTALSDLNPTYKKTVNDDLEKTGSEQDSNLHGLSTTTTPTDTTTNKIIPLGGSAETELNQTVNGGSITQANSGTDTLTKSFTNRWDKRKITEELEGATISEKLEIYKGYRELIIDINSMIFEKMRKDHLFMEVW